MELPVTGILVAAGCSNSQTPKLPYETPENWDFGELLGRTGRAGNSRASFGIKRLKNWENILPGLLTTGLCCVYNQDAGDAAARSLERKRMDWIPMLIPLKWVLLCVVLYFVISSVL